MASGSGTNAENIIRYFSDHPEITVSLVLSNKADALVLERARKLRVPSDAFSREEFKSPAFLSRFKNVDYVILAGFLWLIPSYLIDAFPDKIINIHPSLLPKFGGKSMYGQFVHQAVVDAGEKESGITIHLVNGRYDEGKILFQSRLELVEYETPDSLAGKIHQLEYEHFPKVIEKWVTE